MEEAVPFEQQPDPGRGDAPVVQLDAPDLLVHDLREFFTAVTREGLR
ncbi:hypothetical protein [Amycolatopsis saalfeldensis]|uniref:Uncharacterized protein n=1 Tax=Amycolatopsis saalfeldensis TaxID=394193 RepID=A0A1H8YP34_9PSEU|nr:hypothetical protein [Amycolatopsis saalfeldensis]SEP53138.1 hypothetical protein SAMN04489732_124109 [Amycolatopsis saalfeldensis]